VNEVVESIKELYKYCLPPLHSLTNYSFIYSFSLITGHHMLHM